MNANRTSLEVIAPSIEEAVTKGLTDLGLPKDAVEIEILDEGSRGLFGLGSRQARIRLTIKSASTSKPESPPISKSEEPVPWSESTSPPPLSQQMAEEPQAESIAIAEQSSEEDAILRVARETVSELLDKMRVKAQVSASFGDPDEPHSKAPLLVDIHGNDLSILIGRHAETLNALQYISSLILGKELGHSIPLVIDVEGYRVRREQQIRQLARRMAEQAIKTGRRQILEPMPSNERRIVHMELRSNPEVTTESVGEDPRRKVTIIPKQP
jgi:spoIIIJ-associated protein